MMNRNGHCDVGGSCQHPMIALPIITSRRRERERVLRPKEFIHLYRNIGCSQRNIGLLTDVLEALKRGSLFSDGFARVFWYYWPLERRKKSKVAFFHLFGWAVPSGSFRIFQPLKKKTLFPSCFFSLLCGPFWDVLADFLSRSLTWTISNSTFEECSAFSSLEQQIEYERWRVMEDIPSASPATTTRLRTAAASRFRGWPAAGAFSP